MSRFVANGGLPRPPRFHVPVSPARAGLAVAFLLATLVAGFAGAWLQDRYDTGTSLAQERRIVTSSSRLISQIAKEVGPSVVSVNVDVETGDRGPFGLADSVAQAAGTGIIISESGYILTNRHVVPADTAGISVTLSDGTELKDVSLVGRTNQNDSLDIAFLKINDAAGHKLSPASLGDSAQVQVGDSVVAIGNALGQFQNTVTSGIISGFGRNVVAEGDENQPEALNDLFQTDAAINEGNSGGPLVSMNSEVIGINTAVAGDGAENIGFAIPSNDVRSLVQQVLQDGKFSRPYLGVRYVPVTTDIAKEFDLKVSDGAFIVPSDDALNPSVLSGSPADKAGLKEKDVIVAVNDKKVDQRHSLTSLLGLYKPGEEVELTVQRGSETIKIKVKLASL